MTDFEKLSRKTWTHFPYDFKPVAPMPPNTLTNADGTPYQAGYDDKSLGQIAYETYNNEIGHATARPWHLQLATYQQIWEKVAEAVIKESHEIRT